MLLVRMPIGCLRSEADRLKLGRFLCRFSSARAWSICQCKTLLLHVHVRTSVSVEAPLVARTDDPPTLSEHSAQKNIDPGGFRPDLRVPWMERSKRGWRFSGVSPDQISESAALVPLRTFAPLAFASHVRGET